MKSGSLWNYYRDEIDDFDDNTSQVNHLSIRQTGKTEVQPPWLLVPPERGGWPPRPPLSSIKHRSHYSTQIY